MCRNFDSAYYFRLATYFVVSYIMEDPVIPRESELRPSYLFTVQLPFLDNTRTDLCRLPLLTLAVVTIGLIGILLP